MTLLFYFGSKIRKLSLFSSYSYILDGEKKINKYVFMFLPGGTLALDELQCNNREKKSFKRSSIIEFWVYCSIYIVSLADYLTNTIIIISSSLEFLFD